MGVTNFQFSSAPTLHSCLNVPGAAVAAAAAAVAAAVVPTEAAVAAAAVDSQPEVDSMTEGQTFEILRAADAPARATSLYHRQNLT